MNEKPNKPIISVVIADHVTVRDMDKPYFLDAMSFANQLYLSCLEDQPTTSFRWGLAVNTLAESREDTWEAAKKAFAQSGRVVSLVSDGSVQIYFYRQGDGRNHFYEMNLGFHLDDGRLGASLCRKPRRKKKPRTKTKKARRTAKK